MESDRSDFYRNLRIKIKDWLNKNPEYKWSEILLLAPDLFHLLCKLTADKDIPVTEKAKLAGVIAYFISPIDLIPEILLGPVGYLDDIALAAYVLNSLINKTDPEIIRRHWAGETDILLAVKNILAMADEMVGSGLWKKIKNRL
ncbi:YkvA family protein [candidate division KSB1 bacterium]